MVHTSRPCLSLLLAVVVLMPFAPVATAGGRVYAGTVAEAVGILPVVLGVAYDSHPRAAASLVCGAETVLVGLGGHAEQFYGGLKLGPRRSHAGGARPYVLGGLGLVTILGTSGRAGTSYLGAGVDIGRRSGRLAFVELRRVMPVRDMQYGATIVQLGVGFGR
jgi:hypothetical protein